ncbi:MAG: hypothetical protein V4534_05430 [Myxococcota bacterium]
MKKNKFSILLAISFLACVGCGGKQSPELLTIAAAQSDAQSEGQLGLPVNDGKVEMPSDAPVIAEQILTIKELNKQLELLDAEGYRLESLPAGIQSSVAFHVANGAQLAEMLTNDERFDSTQGKLVILDAEFARIARNSPKSAGLLRWIE